MLRAGTNRVAALPMLTAATESLAGRGFLAAGAEEERMSLLSPWRALPRFGRVLYSTFVVGFFFVASTPALAQGRITVEREIEMRGPMLSYSASETGEARLSLDLCTNPAGLAGEGTMTLEGSGHRSAVRLTEEGTGTVTIEGWAACLPEADVHFDWQERWHSTQTATWPGGGRQFQVPWQDDFEFTVLLRTGSSGVETDQRVTYPQSPVDQTTSTTAFTVNLCVRLCDPARVVAELAEHLRLADGWKRSVFQTDLAPRAGEPLPDFRDRVEAWIDDTTPGVSFPAGEGWSPPPGTEGAAGGSPGKKTPVDGAQEDGSAPFPHGGSERMDTVPESGTMPYPRGQTDDGGTETLTQRPSNGQATTGGTPIPRDNGAAGSENPSPSPSVKDRREKPDLRPGVETGHADAWPDGETQDLREGPPMEGLAGGDTAAQDLTPRPDQAGAPMSGADAPRTVANGAALGAGPISLVRRLRVDPTSCAIEHVKDSDRWAPVIFPLSQDCILQSVATRRVLTEKARCLAARECSLDADDPIAGPGTACMASAAYATLLREDISILEIHQVEAHCDSARRLLWWLEQHAACNRLHGGLGDIRCAVAGVCDPVADIDTGTEGETSEWSPRISFCNEDCEAHYSRREDIEICIVECRQRLEELRNARQRASDALSDFGTSAKDLWRTLTEIMKEIARQRSQAVQGMTR